jgi:hypothetical protein
MSKKVETEKERELRWQTERDFEILMDYEKLVRDLDRLARAKKLAKEKQNELSALLKINKKED